MRIKFLLLIMFVLIISFSIFSLALTDKYKYTFTVNVNKGWNLLPEAGLDYAKIDESFLSQEQKGLYYSGFDKKRYLYIHSVTDEKSKYALLGGIEDEQEMKDVYSSAKKGFTHFTPSWRYFKKDATLTLTYKSAPISIFSGIASLKLKKGWNFVTVMPYFLSGDLQTPGNCKILKSYAWYVPDQKWISFSWQTDALEDLIGRGVVVKVAEDCEFSKLNNEKKSTISNSNPPAIPTD